MKVWVLYVEEYYETDINSDTHVVVFEEEDDALQYIEQYYGGQGHAFTDAYIHDSWETYKIIYPHPGGDIENGITLSLKHQRVLDKNYLAEKLL